MIVNQRHIDRAYSNNPQPHDRKAAPHRPSILPQSAGPVNEHGNCVNQRHIDRAYCHNPQPHDRKAAPHRPSILTQSAGPAVNEHGNCAHLIDMFCTHGNFREDILKRH